MGRGKGKEEGKGEEIPHNTSMHMTSKCPSASETRRLPLKIQHSKILVRHTTLGMSVSVTPYTAVTSYITLFVYLHISHTV